jgi:hypothetical protein
MKPHPTTIYRQRLIDGAAIAAQLAEHLLRLEDKPGDATWQQAGTATLILEAMQTALAYTKHLERIEP